MTFEKWFCIGLLCVLGCSESDSPTTIEFLNVRVEEISATEAAIRFTTSVPTSCDVLYGTSPDNLDMSESAVMDEPYAIEHEVWLSKLSPETTYHFRPSAESEDGATAHGELRSFDTVIDEMISQRNVAMMEEGGSVMSVSSNFGNAENDGSFGANAAIDGNMSTEWSSNGDGDDATITIGFEAEMELVGFSFRSRKMADGTSIVTQIQLFDAAQNDLGIFETPDPDTTYRFDFEEPVMTDSVQVDAVETTGGSTGAKEIMMWVQ